MSTRIIWRVAATTSVCAILGAGVGIAASAASPRRHTTSAQATTSAPTTTSTATTTTRTSTTTGSARGGWLGGRGLVHATAVVLDEAGTGYVNETLDAGTVKSLAGDALTLKEGGSVAHKTVTLTIPSDATVLRDGSTTSLADLRDGDEVVVSQSSQGTKVLAGDGSAAGWTGPAPAGGWRAGGWGAGGPGSGGWGEGKRPGGGGRGPGGTRPGTAPPFGGR